MISVSSLIQAVVVIAVVGLIFWMCNWLIEYIGIQEPFHKVAKVVLAVFCVLIVIGVLLSLIGYPIIRF